MAPERAGELIARGLELMASRPRAGPPARPADPRLKHVIWIGADRSAVAIHPGWLDRSPCGTGTSARMAQLHAHGELAIGEEFVHRSVIGTSFTGRLVEETEHGVIPEITGRAWITGTGRYLLDPTTPSRPDSGCSRRRRGHLRRGDRARPGDAGVDVLLLDRGEVSSGTTGLGEGNVLRADAPGGRARWCVLAARFPEAVRLRAKGSLTIYEGERDRGG